MNFVVAFGLLLAGTVDYAIADELDSAVIPCYQRCIDKSAAHSGNLDVLSCLEGCRPIVTCAENPMSNGCMVSKRSLSTSPCSGTAECVAPIGSVVKPPYWNRTLTGPANSSSGY